MAIRTAIPLGHPKLKAQNQEITDFNSEKVNQVVQDLIDTMRDQGLIGMAAPQIGENYQVFITEPRVTQYRTDDQADELRIYINPKIVKYSTEESIIFEGCGSVINATIFGPVSKPKEITVEAYDLNGKKFQFRCDGILARVIQHEFDHLQGITFIERVKDYSKVVDVEVYKEKFKTSEEQVNNSKITIKEVNYLN